MPDPLHNEADLNPYAASDEPPEDVPDLPEGEFEKVRSQYREVESSLKVLGLIALIFGLISVAIFLLSLLSLLASYRGWEDIPMFFILFGLLGALLSIAGFGLRKLKDWARIVIGLFSLPCLLLTLFSTLISGLELSLPGLLVSSFLTGTYGYAFYLLFSEKGIHVCTEEYRAVIEATPNMQGSMPTFVKLLLCTIGVILAVIVYTVITGG